MEERGQVKEIAMTNSIGYGPHQFNQESSSATKLSSSPIGGGSVVPDRRNEHGHRNTILNPDQTLDQNHQENRQREDKDGGADPDLDPASAQETGETIANAPDSKTTSTQTRVLPRAMSTASSNNSVRYRECLKNHAANMGGHVLDGCGEFMPNGEDETPEALKCAACDCHRSFHRKEVDGEAQIQTGTNHYSTYHPSRINNSTHHTSIHPRPPPSLPPAPSQQHHQHRYTQIFSNNASTGTHSAPVMMAFGGNHGVPAESSSEDLNMYHSNTGTQRAMIPSYPTSRKRFRTKFTSEQKDKMQEFAEKVGWTIQKQDEQELQQFCDDVGVKRQVFKVWMHNNKQAMKKKQT